MTDRDVVASRLRVMHLDLKGLPPASDHLIELLDVFAAAGFNAVLVEWEDMFPWTIDARFRSASAYSPETVNRFVERAAQLDIELIPLVQCLGHMETPLHVEGHASLWEQPDRCDVLNVLAPGARPLVESMIDDVLRLMPSVKRLHLGGDEAWSFATHPDTRAYAEEHGKAALYLHHVGPILDKLSALGIRPLLWHDMMIDWPDDELLALAKKADLVVWGYVGHPNQADHHFNTRYIKRFHDLGMPLWAAGAYKGGDRMSNDLPDLQARITNAQAWMELDASFNFEGLIATSWSRFSTHRVQTEPIDAALDAMFAVGHIFKHGRCPEDFETLLRDAGVYEQWQACHRVMKTLADAREQAWLLIRQMQENFMVAQVSPHRRGSGVIEHDLAGLGKALEQLDDIARSVRAVFEKLVPHDSIDEYLQVRLHAIRNEHDRLQTCTNIST